MIVVLAKGNEDPPRPREEKEARTIERPDSRKGKPMRTINLPCYGIVVTLDGKGGNIRSDLHEHEEEDKEESTDALLDEQEYNQRIDGIEALILGHAVAGIDIESPAYLEGIESAVQGCANN